MSIALLKEMFEERTIKKDASKIPVYYAEDFQLFTNGQVQGYQQFLEDHEKYYASQIQYEIEYDEETLVEDDDGVAARCWITTSRPNEEPTRLEVLLIGKYRDGKITHIWELVWPNWAELPAFTEID